MRIGELARRAGIPVDTVRYYERNGILPAPARRASGYRDYRDDDVARLDFVLRAKRLGFSLVEIRDLLDLSDADTTGSGQVKAIAAARLSDIDRRIAQLGRMRDAIRSLVHSGHQQGASGCPLRTALLDLQEPMR